jgi:FlaA1/EpsC-like NDP-sugar epimerase
MNKLKRVALGYPVPVVSRVHRVPEILRLADALGVPGIAEVVPPKARPTHRPDRPYAVIHAAPMFRYKRWTAEGWRGLAAALASRGLASSQPPARARTSGAIWIGCGVACPTCSASIRSLGAKWRFTSLPDLFNIVRAVTVLAVSLLVLDYILVAPNCLRRVLLRQDHDRLYWFLQMFFLGVGSRIAYRYFRYTRTQQRDAASTRCRRWCSAAPPMPRCCCARSRAARSADLAGRHPVAVAADRGQSMRGVPVVGSLDDLEQVVAIFEARGTHIARLIFTPSRWSRRGAGIDR